MTSPVLTSFIQVLGVNATQQVQARAVAGIEAVDRRRRGHRPGPERQPGLSVSGGGTPEVNGRVVINSQGR